MKLLSCFLRALLVVALAAPAAGQQPASNTAPAQPIDLALYATTATIPQLSAVEGEVILFRGEVDDYRASWNERAPNIIYVRNGDAALEIVFWPEEDDQIPNFTQKGTPVYAEGIVQNYRGRLQLKIDDNARLSTAPLLPAEENPAARPTPSADAPRKPKLTWRPYTPLASQADFQAGKPVVIYARAGSMEDSHAVENAYLLHPDSATFMGERTIYFFDVETPEGKAFSSQLNVFRVPALVVLQAEAEHSRLIFTPQTTPRDVYQFMQAIPR